MANKLKPFTASRDPILSPDEMCEDAGISMQTWWRTYRHTLPIVRVSPRRIGCRQSAWRAALGETVEPQDAAR